MSQLCVAVSGRSLAAYSQFPGPRVSVQNGLHVSVSKTTVFYWYRLSCARLLALYVHIPHCQSHPHPTLSITSPRHTVNHVPIPLCQSHPHPTLSIISPHHSVNHIPITHCQSHIPIPLCQSHPHPTLSITHPHPTLSIPHPHPTPSVPVFQPLPPTFLRPVAVFGAQPSAELETGETTLRFSPCSPPHRGWGGKGGVPGHGKITRNNTRVVRSSVDSYFLIEDKFNTIIIFNRTRSTFNMAHSTNSRRNKEKIKKVKKG